MGNHIDKLDEDLMKAAPLEQDIIENLYFIHDAYRYMDMLLLVCDGITKKEDETPYEKSVTNYLQDLGLILIAAGNHLGRESTFARILLAVGDIEVLLGKLENVWAMNLDKWLVKPMQKCISQNADEITVLRDKLMNQRMAIRDLKLSEDPEKETKLNELEEEYSKLKDETRERLTKEKRTIAEMKKNLTKVLETQMEMNQNSIIHLEGLIDKMKKDPRSIKISDYPSPEDLPDYEKLLTLSKSLRNSHSHAHSFPKSESKLILIDLPSFTKFKRTNNFKEQQKQLKESLKKDIKIKSMKSKDSEHHESTTITTITKNLFRREFESLLSKKDTENKA